MSQDLSMEFHLPVSPEKVMRLLTDTELIKKWSGNNALVERVAGGRFEFFDNWVSGKVTKATGNELEYTWSVIEWEEEVLPSVVHYTLTAESGGTKVDLQHTGLPGEEEKNRHHDGWYRYFFDPMEKFILENDF